MDKFKFAFFTFPLTKGKETGRGLERVIDELYLFFSSKKYTFSYLDLGFIKNELSAISSSIKYLKISKSTFADAYFAVYPVSGIFPAFLGKRPLVTAIHDMVPYNVFGYSNRIKYAFKRWCIKYTAIKSDHIIVGFRSNKEQLKELFNLPDEKFTIIPYAVNQKNYYLDPKIKKIPGRVAFLGEAKRSKGMDSAILAFPLVLKKYPGAKLVLASRGAEFEKMKNLARSTLPQGSYEFVGFVAEKKMREFYAKTEVFVFPSRYGFGLSSLESAACGTPAIAGATLDAVDFWQDKDLLVNPEKPKELAEKIIRLLDDKVFYQQKRDKLLKIAKNYSWETYCQKHYEVFQQTAEKYAKPLKIEQPVAKSNLYSQAKKSIFDQYVDSIFGSAHNPDKIIKEYKQYKAYFRRNYSKYLPKNRQAKILEIGCGMGHFQYFLRSQGFSNVLGIDISSQEIDFCRQQGFSVRRAEALSYLRRTKDSSVDAIIFDDLIYYFTKDDVLAVLANISRVLKKNGVCFIKTLNLSNPITGSNSNFRDFATEINFTEESLAQVCKLSGFSKVMIRPLDIYVFYFNPLNYFAMAFSALIQLYWRTLTVVFGRTTTKIFTKDILAVCYK